MRSYIGCFYGFLESSFYDDALMWRNLLRPNTYKPYVAAYCAKHIVNINPQFHLGVDNPTETMM